MDEKSFDATVERLKKANAVIAKLDPAIRAEAFSVLAPYVQGAAASTRGGGAERTKPAEAGTVTPPKDRADLLAKHEGEPLDNVLVAAAAWYMDYGSAPFSTGDLSEILDSAGMTGPARIDRTLDTTTKGTGKKYFRKRGRGRWQPTVPGEKYFREMFGVKKGNKTPPEGDTS